VLALLLLAGAGAAAVWVWLDTPLPLAKETAELSVEAGTSPRDIAHGWVNAGVQSSPQWLYAYFRWSGQARRIRAGSYEIDAGTTPRQLLAKMVQGAELQEQVRFIEGWTLRQLRGALATAPHLKPLTAKMSEDELMAAVGARGSKGEGRFFPDTYVYSRGVSDITVLKRAHGAMQQRLAAAWAQRAADTPLKSADDALILASIIVSTCRCRPTRP
jgi:UPF0755 protein